MRDTKYKAYYAGLMWFVSEIHFEHGDATMVYLSEDGEFVRDTWARITDEDLHLLQFTGLTDQNSVEIYEGDIVEFTYWWFDGDAAESILTGHIVYSNENMSFQLKAVKNAEWEKFTGYENDQDYLTPFSELNFCDADFSVIGNIHEHPHLLDITNSQSGEN